MNRDELLEKLAMEVSEWPVVKSCMQWDGDNFYPTDFMDRQPFSKIEWLAERDRLINKPSWDSHDYDEVRQDRFGEWQGRYIGGSWSRIRDGHMPTGHRWQDTFEQRPALTTSLGASGWDEDRIDIIGSNGATGEHYSSEPACSCGSVVGEYHNPECSEVNAFQAGRIKGIASNGNDGLAYSAAAWSGEGLPPVGAKCEARNYHYGSCFEITQVVHRTRKGVTLVEYEGGDAGFLIAPADFRPIRSEEDKAVEDLTAVISNYQGDKHSVMSDLAARRVYDAGYRKLDPPMNDIEVTADEAFEQLARRLDEALQDNARLAAENERLRKGEAA